MSLLSLRDLQAAKRLMINRHGDVSRAKLRWRWLKLKVQAVLTEPRNTSFVIEIFVDGLFS